MTAIDSTSALTVRPAGGLVALPTIDAVIDDWLSQYRDATLDTYRRRIILFAEWLGCPQAAVGPVFLGSGRGTANATALAYKNHLIAQGRGSSTINGHLVALRSLVAFGRLVDLFDWNLTVKSEKVKALRDTTGPGMAALADLYNAVKGDGDKAVRDRAILWLLIGQGLRESEIVSLDLGHIGDNRIAIMGKARREREWITLDGNTKNAIAAWVARRGTDAGPLFTSFDRNHAGKQVIAAEKREDKARKEGRTLTPDTPDEAKARAVESYRITRKAIYQLVGYYGRRTGRRVWPHAIRHSAITEIITTTKDVNAARLFARHSSLATTTVYADNAEDLGGKAAAGHADRFATMVRVEGTSDEQADRFATLIE